MGVKPKYVHKHVEEVAHYKCFCGDEIRILEEAEARHFGAEAGCGNCGRLYNAAEGDRYENIGRLCAYCKTIMTDNDKTVTFRHNIFHAECCNRVLGASIAGVGEAVNKTRQARRTITLFKKAMRKVGVEVAPITPPPTAEPEVANATCADCVPESSCGCNDPSIT